jgi:hypothetical protein
MARPAENAPALCSSTRTRATVLSATWKPSLRSSPTCSAIQRAKPMRCDIARMAAGSRAAPTRSSTGRPGAA